MSVPAAFIGHGSPIIALEESPITSAWAEIVTDAGPHEAVLMISAHWLTRGLAVTAMEHPRTVHDFGRSLPAPLFDIQYPAPGAPALAKRVQEVLAPLTVALDGGHWGLDHGAWSVMLKTHPAATTPVVQLSLDATQPPAFHHAVGRRLAPLRDEGVLILGSGNIVHNLSVMDGGGRYAEPYDWAVRFNDEMRGAIAEDRPEVVIGYDRFGRDAALSVADPDHFWPLLCVLGTRAPGEAVRFETETYEYRSLSMMSVVLEGHA